MVCDYCKNKDKCKLIISPYETISCENYEFKVADSEEIQSIITNKFLFHVITYPPTTSAFVERSDISYVTNEFLIQLPTHNLKLSAPKLLMRKIFPTEQQAVKCLEEIGFTIMEATTF